MTYLKKIAQKPHPIGSLENAKVREYLVSELKNIGLEPQIQTAMGIYNRNQRRVTGIVNNVLVRVPGKNSGKALLVAAHYDSTRNGPGAADDGASVAAILEMLKVLKEHPPLQNDLICIFTDGEEAGLLGADAFVTQHPWARDTGLVLNFEYRGNRGPTLMFETSPGNGKLIDGLTKIAANPIGNSLMYEVYKRMPNDTDMTVFKKAGIAGMNFAAIDGRDSYHTQQDRPELMQQGSLQHQGEIMLGLVQWFGNADLADLKSFDSVYFDIAGLGLVSYPVAWAIPLSSALLVFFAGTLLLGLKIGALRAARTAMGAALFLIVVLLCGSVCQLLGSGIDFIYSEHDLMPEAGIDNSQWYLLAFVILSMGMFGVAQAGIKAWISPIEFTMGAAVVWLVILFTASVAAPGASFLFFWPLASILVVLSAMFLLHVRCILSPGAVLLFMLGAAPGIVLFAPFLKLLFIALTANQIGIVTGFVGLLLGLLTPLLNLFSGRFILPSASFIIGLSILIMGSV